MLLKKILLGVALFVLLAGLFPGCSSEMYELEVIVDGSGEVKVEPEKDFYGEGDEVKLTPEPEEGYKLQEWRGHISDEKESGPVTVVMDSDITVRAEFVEIIEGLSINVEGEGSVTYPEIENPEEKEFTDGETVKIKAEPNPGYKFDGWQGYKESNEETIEITVEEEMEELTAVFVQEELPDNISLGGSGSGTVIKKETEDHDEVFVPVVDENSYFVGWKDGGEVEKVDLEDEEGYLLNEGEKYTAIITEISGNFAVEEEYTGGEVDLSPVKDEYEDGDSVTINAQPYDGYTYTGWLGDIDKLDESEDEDKSKELTVVIGEDIGVDELIGLYAVFEPLGELDLDTVGEGRIKLESGEYVDGDEVTIEAEPEDGHEFVEWGGDISGDENPKEIIVGEVEEITAEFKTSTYEIEVSEEAIEGEGELVVENDNDFPEEDFEHGEMVKLKARPGDFHQFSHWKEDKGRPPHNEDELEITMEATSDLKLAGVFEEIPYNFERESGTIIDYDSDAGWDVEIPGEIDGIDVTAIGREAFKETKLEQVVLPDTLEVINSGAFADNELGTVVIPDSVERIGENAFKNNELQSFDLPLNADVKVSAFDEDLTEIFEEYSDQDYVRYQQDDGYYLFNKDEAMITEFETDENYDGALSIPEKVGVVGVKFIEDGFLEGTTIREESIYAAFHSLELEKIQIPEGIIGIGEYVFSYNNLEKVDIPDSVEEIEDYAFANNNIDQLEIPDSVEHIGSDAFENNNIKQLEIPASVEYFGFSVFENNNIEQLEIPDSFKKIKSSAFDNNNLEKVDIPDSVEEIDYWAFKNNNIKQLEIPDSVTKIGYGAFIKNELSSVTIGTAVELEIQDISFVAYEGCGPFSVDGSFKETYEANDREAGEYVKEDGEWKKAEE